MSYHITHRGGRTEDQPSLDSLADLYDELDYEDAEHTDVSLTHESEWCLSAFGNGLLTWGNLEVVENEDCHMKNVSKEKIIELWQRLAEGRIDEINQEQWLPGYGSK